MKKFVAVMGTLLLSVSAIANEPDPLQLEDNLNQPLVEASALPCPQRLRVFQPRKRVELWIECPVWRGGKMGQQVMAELPPTQF